MLDGNGTGVTNMGTTSVTISFTAGTGDGSVWVVYEDIPPSYTLTVNAGGGSGSYTEGSRVTINGSQAPNGYEFDYWEIISGNGSINNGYAKITIFNVGNTNAEITAHYKPIPTFNVIMQNGYIWNGVTWSRTATLLRDSNNEIKIKPAPLGYQFSQWEVYENGVLQTNATDINNVLAERTSLRGLTRNITIKATYSIPDSTISSTLTIIRNDGSTDQNNYTIGTNVNITASSPDTGMKFYKWTGDVDTMLGGIYNSSTYITMPAQSITIQENYVAEDYVIEYDLVMTNIYGQCCYTTSSEDLETGEIVTTDNWVSRWTYPAGTTVRIRTYSIPSDYSFNSWDAVDHITNTDARAVIANITAKETTITMPNYDIDVEPNLALKMLYELRINNGATSGYYYEDTKVDVYFNKTDTTDIHYQFTTWIGATGTDISSIELFDGGTFNTSVAGSSSTPQYIKMPKQRTEITAVYKTLYRLTLTNGIINTTSTTEGFYETGTTVEITADAAPSGMRFQYWTGNTNGLTSIYDPTTTVTTISGVTEITAVYSTDADRNEIGYTSLDLKNTNIVNNNDVTIISGDIEVGFIITDANGHIYIVTNIDTQNNTSTIYRMTKIVEGGNIYG